MPVKHVAISASHEIYPSMAAAVKAMVGVRVANLRQRERQARRSGRSRRQRLVETTPMLRSIDGGVDDQKFLYPVLDNLPLILFPLLSYALSPCSAMRSPGSRSASTERRRSAGSWTWCGRAWSATA
jgi:hypothetical protein